MLPTEKGWTLSPPTLMPLDREPVENGNCTIIPATPDGIPPRVHVLKKAEIEAGVPEGTLRYMTHFVTCPEAGRFRR